MQGNKARGHLTEGSDAKETEPGGGCYWAAHHSRARGSTQNPTNPPTLRQPRKPAPNPPETRPHHGKTKQNKGRQTADQGRPWLAEWQTHHPITEARCTTVVATVPTVRITSSQLGTQADPQAELSTKQAIRAVCAVSRRCTRTVRVQYEYTRCYLSPWCYKAYRYEYSWCDVSYSYHR